MSAHTSLGEPGVAGYAATIRPRRSTRRTITPYLYLAPAALLVAVFLLYPVIETIYLSFTKFDGLNPPQFIDINNYVLFFNDAAFGRSLANTIVWVFATLAFPVLLGLAIAATANQLRGQTTYKWIFYFPYAISFTTAGVLWTFLLGSAGAGGTINGILGLLGLESLQIPWLYTPPANTGAMITAYTWQTMGANMVLFLVGLQNLPTDPIEAAQIDGANGWQTFRFVTWPLLQPIAIVVVVMAVVNSFKVFDLIWVMTQGGPYRSSETLAVTMYWESFVTFKMGYGAAIAIFLSVFVLALSWVYLRRALPTLE